MIRRESASLKKTAGTYINHKEVIIRKTMCKWEKSKEGCKFKEKCWYQHENSEEIEMTIKNYKERENVENKIEQHKGINVEIMCKWEKRKGGCKFKEKCHYKHENKTGEEEFKEQQYQNRREENTDRMKDEGIKTLGERMTFLEESVTQVKILLQKMTGLSSHSPTL